MGIEEQKVAAWMRIVNSQKPLPSFDIWIEEDKEQLFSLKNKKLNLGDTALSQAKDLHERERLLRHLKLSLMNKGKHD